MKKNGTCSPGLSQIKTPVIKIKVRAFLIVGFFVFISPILLFAQAPALSYANPQVFTAGVTIAPLIPANTGSSVTPGIYSNTPIEIFGAVTSPTGVAVDTAGNVYVADAPNILKIPAGSRTSITILSNLNSPFGVAVDAAGNVYYGSVGDNTVKMLPAGGGIPLTLASGFFDPYGLVVDAIGNVYVADRFNNAIKKIPAGGGAPVTLGSGFNNPCGVAVDDAGNVFVADRGNNAIKKIPADGSAPITLGYGFSAPCGVAVDPSGNIFVSDRGNHAIKEIPAGTNNVITLASGFQTPIAITLDKQGNLFVDDNGGANGPPAIYEIKVTGSYSISPILPTGLVFRNTTGVITGTPVVSSPATNYTITGSNTGGSSTTTVNIKVQTSAALSGLKLSSGVLSPAFNMATTNYTDTVNVASVLVTPTTADRKATITVNGFTVTSASPSAGIPLSIGINNISIVVTAADGITKKTYAIAVNKIASPNANLSDLTLSAGFLNPIFITGTTSYTASASSATASITVTPTTADPHATLKVNGLAVSSVTASPNIPLTLGLNTITTVVTAQDGTTTNSYTILVTKYPLATVSYNTPQIFTIGVPIAPLSPTSGAVAPPGYGGKVFPLGSGFINPISVTVDQSGNIFAGDQNGIVYKIPFGSNTPIIWGTFKFPYGLATDVLGNLYVADQRVSNAIFKIPASGGSPVSMAYALPTDKNFTNNLTLDRSGNIYVLTANNVIKMPASGGSPITLAETGGDETNGIVVDAYGNVYITDGTTFSILKIPAIGGVPKAIYTGYIFPDSMAIDGAGNLFVSDFNGALISEIPFGSNTPITIATGFNAPNALAIDGRGNIYVADTNAPDIKQIKPTGGYFINPVLPAGLNFNSTTGVISGTPQLPNPVINYTITAYNPGNSGSANLNIKISATDANLTSLSLSSGALSPAFSGSITSYTDTVSNATTSVTITPTSADPNASIKVKGIAVNSGTATPSLPLIVGNNAITTVVTAQDGVTTQSYTVNVTRLSNNANLAGLSLSSGSLSPAFASSTQAYTASVSNATASINITPTVSDPTATIKVNGVLTNSGAASANIPLALSAPTSIKIVVTAQNGTVKTYQVMVTRLSNNSNLTNLTLSKGVLSPAFATPTQNYTASVTNATTSISITLTTSSAVATVKVNGTSVVSGTASAAIPLVVGTNVVRAQVTAQDGTVKTYTITISRALSSNANLAGITLSNGTLSPAFNTTTQVYAASVSNVTASITLTAITSDVTATIKVNGASVVSGTASAGIPLALSAPTGIHVVVTAQDGTVKTYTVNVTRLSNNANLINLTLNNGTLTPSFTVSNQNYTASVDNTITSVSLTPTTSSALATVTVNGLTTTSGTASSAISMNVGANVIHVVVAAQDGTLKTYTVTVTRAMGSLNSIYTPGANGSATPLIASLNNEQVIANNILSPNGDGINDIWVVKNIAFYPNNRVTVYDRTGTVIFTKKNYTNDWAGSYRGSVLKEGTYFYLIDLGNGDVKKGFITVVRDR